MKQFHFVQTTGHCTWLCPALSHCSLCVVVGFFQTEYNYRDIADGAPESPQSFSRPNSRPSSTHFQYYPNSVEMHPPKTLPPQRQGKHYLTGHHFVAGDLVWRTFQKVFSLHVGKVWGDCHIQCITAAGALLLCLLTDGSSRRSTPNSEALQGILHSATSSTDYQKKGQYPGMVVSEGLCQLFVHMEGGGYYYACLV